MDVEFKRIFSKLKPVCDQVVRDPTESNIRNLSMLLNDIPCTVLNEFLEYVLYPVNINLLKLIRGEFYSTHQITELLVCIKIALQKSLISKETRFDQQHGMLLQVITGRQRDKIANLAENCKRLVIECLTVLYNNMDEKLIPHVYKRSSSYMIPQTVYICTQIAHHEHDLKLRIASLECILSIATIGNRQTLLENDTELRNNVAEIFATIFPGIISCCINLIKCHSMVHHKIVVHALKLFAHVVILTFEPTEAVPDLCLKYSPPNDIHHVKRTADWFEKTTGVLSTLIKFFISLCSNDHWKVRRELVIVAKSILSKCYRSIGDCSTGLIEILIILSKDQIAQVSELAETEVKVLLNNNTVLSKLTFEFMEENVCLLLAQISSTINSANEETLLCQLNLLNGYLSLLQLNRFFKSLPHLESFVQTFVHLLEFDHSSLNSIATVSVKDFSKNDSFDAHTTRICWKHFKHLSEKSEIAVRSICCVIAENVNTEDIVYYLIEWFEECEDTRKEIAYLINHIILCDRKQYTEEEFEIMKTVVKLYINSAYWSIPLSFTDDEKINKSLSWSLLHNNVLQACLLLEGIGNVAAYMKKEFKPLLLLSLYGVIERAGSSNDFVSSVGLEALRKVTLNCNYSSVTDLITDNVDYITYHVNIRLKNLLQNKGIFDVLSVIIDHSKRSSMSTLCDIIELLLRSDDIIYDTYLVGFLRVFKMFVRKIRSWFTPEYSQDCYSLNESDEVYINFLQTMDEHVRKHKNDHECYLWESDRCDDTLDINDIFESDRTDDVDTFDEHAVIDEEEMPPHEIEHNETKKEVPQHIELVVSIAERILHVLPKNNSMNKVLIVEILMDTLLILSDTEDHLLPVVHKIWSPLVNRVKFDKQDGLIVRRAFELLCVMAVTARDFIKNRTLKDILSDLTNFLQESLPESKLKDRKSTYRMSQKYKLQRTVLSEIGYLAVYVMLQEKEIHSILEAITPFLNNQQPKPLQIASMNSIRAIAKYHRDFVWVYLLSYSNIDDLKPPDEFSELGTIKIMKNQSASLLLNNVNLILNTL